MQSSKLRSFFLADLSFVFEVYLVAHQGDDELFYFTVLVYFPEPLFDSAERIIIGDVVNEKYSLYSPVVLRGKGPVLLLASRVPY